MRSSSKDHNDNARGFEMNTRKTTFLMALLTVILVTIGGYLAGQGSMTIAFLLALAVNNVSFHHEPKDVQIRRDIMFGLLFRKACYRHPS